MNDLFPPAYLWLPGVSAMLGLTLVSGFFSASETALFYLSHEELRTMRVGNMRERVAAELMRRPARLLTAVLFWNLVINLAYFATSVVVTRRMIVAGFPAAAGMFGVGGLFAIIVLGEVMPKSGAVVFRRRLASTVSFPLALAVRVLDPLSPLLAKLTQVSRRTFWPDLQREPILEAEDLERAVAVSELSQELMEQERQVLHNVLDLSEIAAEEVMRPRGTYVALPPPIHLSDLQGEVSEAGYVLVLPEEAAETEQAIPLDEFSAIPDTHLESAAEEVVYAPWCASLADILQLLRERFCGVAVVVNEYGESIGIITYEDIIDTIFSPQPSRAKRVLQREPVLEVSPGNYHVEGMTTLRYLCSRLDLDYEPFGDGVYTVAGMLHDELQHIPRVGDECFWRGYRIKVIESEHPGRLRALFSRLPKQPTDPVPEPQTLDQY